MMATKRSGTRFVGCWIAGRDKKGNIRVTDAMGWNVWDDGCVDVKGLKDQTLHIGEVFACWTFWNVEDEARQGGGGTKEGGTEGSDKAAREGQRDSITISISISIIFSSRF